MIWKLYLDDIRTPNDSTFLIARNVGDAQQLIQTCGVPSFISFDHDLGIDHLIVKELQKKFDTNNLKFSR